MQIVQGRRFAKAIKRLHANQKHALDDAIRQLIADPAVGSLKVGDLSGVRVYKFMLLDQLTLLAYEVDEPAGIIHLLALGSHQNFYRELKQ